MARVALLSNPQAAGNGALLPRVRDFCARHPDVFHYEVERPDQIGDALATIARVKPKLLVINGGDGTVQAALTELHNARPFGENPPPVAVVPTGRTNLIAHDLGADGDPMEALERAVALAREDLSPFLVSRGVIALSAGGEDAAPVLGLFLGGAGLADSILYCRNKLYPLGLPTGLAHFATLAATLVANLVGTRGRLLPPRPGALKISVVRRGQLQGRFAFLMVTTLERLLFHGRAISGRAGALQVMAIERRPLAMLRALFDSMAGRLGRRRLSGVHLETGDEIRIEGEKASVVLDGELYQAARGHPIVLRPGAPVEFVKLAA